MLANEGEYYAFFFKQVIDIILTYFLSYGTVYKNNENLTRPNFAKKKSNCMSLNNPVYINPLWMNMQIVCEYDIEN